MGKEVKFRKKLKLVMGKLNCNEGKDECNVCKENLNFINDKMTNGIKIRSRWNWYELDEKSNKFYKKSFEESLQNNSKKLLEFLKDIQIPSLTEKQKKVCETELTEKKIYHFLISMENNKSPGNSGLAKSSTALSRIKLKIFS